MPTKVGDAVYVRDAKYSWIPAVVTSVTSTTADVSIQLPNDWTSQTYAPSHHSLKKVQRIAKLADYPGNELPLQNKDVDGDGNADGKSDMADLTHLHEAAILYNLKERHGAEMPYTRVGDILVAMNPYQWIDGLYSEKKKQFYAERLVWNAPSDPDDFTNRQDIGYFDRLVHDPHVYEASSHAYRGLASKGRDQAILVSGESGAGKTETVKIVMAHLAAMEGTRNGGGGGTTDSEIVEKISESNPLFEAFGNASTVRNQNSSRFGKFTKLHFRLGGTPKGGGLPGCTLVGSAFDTYLLEKSRVAIHHEGERTYHVFYQLLAAPEEEKAAIWTGLAGTDCSSFRCVGEPPHHGPDGNPDAEAWVETRDALASFGYGAGTEGFGSLMTAVCAVLQLGNVTFGLDPSDDEGSVVESSEEVDKLSGLLGVDSESVTSALTARKVVTFGEEILARNTPSQACDARDALAKEMYAQVFETLVEAINEATDAGATGKKTGSIAILDMFGFESFKVNRFEQLCINYANESIQHKYASDIFLAAKEEYEPEGIEIFDFSKVDNSSVLDLIESRTGLIMVLNDECLRPKGNDESFVYKSKQIHRDSTRLLHHGLHRRTEFAIRHFAGDVKYDATGFVERNMDRLPTDLLELACSSSNIIIQRRFGKLADAVAEVKKNYRRKRAVATICTKFRTQLSDLMKDIRNSKTRYIRCVKPNGDCLPLITDHDMTMKQLASAGLVTAIMVERETFPSCLPYSVIWDRFNILLPEDFDTSGDMETKAKRLLEFLLEGKEKVVAGEVIAPYACGKTKVFFRSGAQEELDSQRQGIFDTNATIIQNWYRTILLKRKFGKAREASIVIQSFWRMCLAKKLRAAILLAIVRLQCWARCTLAVTSLYRLRRMKAASAIQSRWRAHDKRSELLRFRRAANVIRRNFVATKNRESMSSALSRVVEEAQMDQKAKDFQKKLYAPATYDRDELLEECGITMGYLTRQLSTQRIRSTELGDQANRAREAAALSQAHASAVESSMAASKLEITKLRGSNARLRSHVGEIKAGTVNLKHLIKNMQEAHNDTKRKQRAEYEDMKTSYEDELAAMKRELREVKRQHAAEVEELRGEMMESEERNRREVERLHEELNATEENHTNDLYKMMDALAVQEGSVRSGVGDGGMLRDSSSEEEELRDRLETMKMNNVKAARDLQAILCDKCQREFPPVMELLGLNQYKGGSRNLQVD